MDDSAIFIYIQLLEVPGHLSVESNCSGSYCCSRDLGYVATPKGAAISKSVWLLQKKKWQATWTLRIFSVTQWHNWKGTRIHRKQHGRHWGTTVCWEWFWQILKVAQGYQKVNTGGSVRTKGWTWWTAKQTNMEKGWEKEGWEAFDWNDLGTCRETVAVPF